ncbi:MAG TPA: class I SAM-dependent methyltransferase, partial [Rhodanobacter sp.]|nr:class I SAM-dependent methyltransferase [Rhodanobacter sp.]
ARGFFDTVLVDGGHTSDVVANDTDKALPLLRSGGVMIWHDFCPVSTVLATSEAGRGVMRAWVAHHDRWRPHLTELFWVRPSWMLIGVKA